MQGLLKFQKYKCHDSSELCDSSNICDLSEVPKEIKRHQAPDLYQQGTDIVQPSVSNSLWKEKRKKLILKMNNKIEKRKFLFLFNKKFKIK